ncbi:MAG: serine/threonine-protein kinase [Acidobacteriota bacterium]
MDGDGGTSGDPGDVRSSTRDDALTPELWRRLEPLLDDALDQPTESRRRWALRATEDCRELRSPLLDWIERCADADGFLDAGSPMNPAPTAGDGDDEARLGQSLGPFRLVRILGRGGMGVVYLGRREDGLFEQEVAVKVVDRRLGPDGLERFRWERRILARLDHPSIARLLDGGTLGDGTPYLVMERITGDALDRHCRTRGLPVGRRVALVIEVLRALDAAHRHRVVHLDLKPSNILVTDEGAVKLVDFGIAQLLSGDTGAPPSDGLTPSFAAPERWTRESLTTGSDLYSVGVILFLLLAGRLPTEDERTAESPPGAGAELDAIVGRLLARRPDARYASATSAAADLERYLRRQPVEAVGGGAAYRARKHLSRHPKLWAAAAGLAALALALAAGWWQQRERAQRRLEVVADFSRSAESGESFLRYVYALPPHDVRREKALAEERLAKIESTMAALGDIASGPGHYALGRGWAGLGRTHRAVEHFEEAWRQGLRTPELAYAWGVALGEVYSRKQDRLWAIADAELRRQLLLDHQRRYRDRALELLRRAAGASETISPQALAGLIAYYDEDLDAALEAARRATVEAPWLPDGSVLAARVELRRARELTDSGRHDEAAERLHAARRDLEEARRLAPSDPRLGLFACSAELQALDLERQRRSSVDAAFATAERRCLEAIELDPDQPGPRSLLATFEILRGQSPGRPVVARSASIARALELLEAAPVPTVEDADLARTHATGLLARALLGLATGAADAGRDLAAATELFERSLALDPGQVLARLNHATALAVGAQLAQATAGDGEVEAAYDRAARAFEFALERLPESTLLRYNLASQHYARGLWLEGRGRSAAPAYAAALDGARRALERNDRLAHVLNLHGAVLERLAHLSSGEDREAGEAGAHRIEEGLASLDRAVELNPASPSAWMTRGALLITDAEFRLRFADPEGARAQVQEAISSLERAEQLLGRRTELGLRNGLRAHRLQAKVERTLGGDPGPSRGRARALLEEAELRFPGAPWLSPAAPPQDGHFNRGRDDPADSPGPGAGKPAL